MSFTIFIKKSFLFFDSLRYRKFSKIMVREIEFPSQTVIDIFPTTHDHAHDPILAWWRKKQVMTFCSPCFIGIFNTVQAHPSRQMHHPGLGRPFASIPPHTRAVFQFRHLKLAPFHHHAPQDLYSPSFRNIRAFARLAFGKAARVGSLCQSGSLAIRPPALIVPQMQTARGWPAPLQSPGVWSCQFGDDLDIPLGRVGVWADEMPAFDDLFGHGAV